jgi:hypothetical protein
MSMFIIILLLRELLFTYIYCGFGTPGGRDGDPAAFSLPGRGAEFGPGGWLRVRVWHDELLA